MIHTVGGGVRAARLMTLRTRVTLAAGFAVLLAVVAMSIAVYAVERATCAPRLISP
jgi:hypothetical protein